MRLSDATTAYQYAIYSPSPQTQRQYVQKLHVFTVWCVAQGISEVEQIQNTNLFRFLAELRANPSTRTNRPLSSYMLLPQEALLAHGSAAVNRPHLYQGRAKASAFMPEDETPSVCVLTMFRILCYNFSMKQPTGFRLTPEARALLDAMSKATGISHTAMLEILIREGAKKRGIRADPRIQAENQQKPANQD